LETVDSSSQEDMILILTNKNNFKQILLSTFEDMMKNGSLKERQEIYLKFTKCKTIDEFVIFTSCGQYVKATFTDLIGSIDFLGNFVKNSV
jgi:DNA gyrase/topoisomerase IV subunit A